MKLNENGEYTNIVVKIGREVQETSCDQLLTNIKVEIIVTAQLNLNWSWSLT